LAESIGRYKDAGVPEKLARPVCALAHMNAALDIVCIAGADSRSVPVMARVYFGIGARFGFDWLRNTARRIETQTGWQRQAAQAMIDELYGLQHDLVIQVIDAAGAATAVDAIVSVWADARKELVARMEQTLADMQAAPSADLAMVAVALRQLRVLVTG
jgi:glutamate dehydrogenase